jgi:hypothetical protein
VFEHNHAEVGGAVLVDDCVATFQDVRLGSNQAQYGGGLYSFGGEIHLDGVEVSDNVAVYAGGGLGLEGSYAPVAVTMIDSVVAGNEAEMGGGLVLFEDAQLSCEGSAEVRAGFLANRATWMGGAVYATGADREPLLRGAACDMGVDGDDNDPADVTNDGGTFGFGDDATFACDWTGCR